MTIEQQTIAALKARIKELEEENAMLRRINKSLDQDNLNSFREGVEHAMDIRAQVDRMSKGGG